MNKLKTLLEIWMKQYNSSRDQRLTTLQESYFNKLEAALTVLDTLGIEAVVNWSDNGRKIKSIQIGEELDKEFITPN